MQQIQAMPRQIESNSNTYFIWIECGWSWCCRHFANLLFCGFWCLHTMRIRYDALVIIVFHFSTLTPNNCWWRNREIGVVLSKTHMFEKWETTKKCEMRSEIFCLTRNNFNFFPNCIITLALGYNFDFLFEMREKKIEINLRLTYYNNNYDRWKTINLWKQLESKVIYYNRNRREIRNQCYAPNPDWFQSTFANPMSIHLN